MKEDFQVGRTHLYYCEKCDFHFCTLDSEVCPVCGGEGEYDLNGDVAESVRALRTVVREGYIVSINRTSVEYDGEDADGRVYRVVRRKHGGGQEVDIFRTVKEAVAAFEKSEL